MENSLCSLKLLLWVLFLTSCNSPKTGDKNEITSKSAPELKSILINGDSLHYIDIGQGTPVVFVHGSLGDYRSWAAQMDTFAENHRVIAYSRRFAFPNRQVINDSADYTAIPHAKDLAELLKALKLEPVHLVGHSYGAFTALLTTLNHPELVRSLTLGEPPVMSLLVGVDGGDTMMNNFVSNAILPAATAFRNNDNEQAVKVFISAVMDDSLYYSRLSPQTRKIMMENTLETRGSVFTKNLFPEVSCADLSKIQSPVLLLQEDRSPLFLTSIITQLDRCLTNKEKSILANTTHGLQYENPSDFNRIVLRFINSR